MAIEVHYPPELLTVICGYVYALGLPANPPSLDPHFSDDAAIPTSLPSAYPSGNWSEAISRTTLARLCLVNHEWFEAAKPWLWRKVEVRLPRSWLALVDEIVWNEDILAMDYVADLHIKAAVSAAMDPMDVERQLQESIFDCADDIPNSSVPPELLSPAASRDPSPRRVRAKSKSPARWQIMRTISDTIQDVLARREPGLYVPTPDDPRPGRYVRHLDFNHFRTIGMRRSVDEGVHSRFVTGDRVQAVLKEMPNLTSFGATEYMDGALTLSVLEELFLRGAPSGGRGRSSRGRASDPEEEDRERRRQCRDLVAIDLTGCVSAIFVNALTKFVETRILPSQNVEASSESEDDSHPRSGRRSSREERLLFPGLARLGLRGVKSVLPNILTSFVVSFPSLTHLDLSATRAAPELLEELGHSNSVRLRSLALARCIQLNSQSIRHILVDSPVTSTLTELNLYGDATFPSPLTIEDLGAIINMAPCFANEILEYLDLSSAPLTKELIDSSKPQSRLRSLGLSHMPNLDLKSIAHFVKSKAPNVEVLTLVGTSPELDCGLRSDGLRGTPRTASVSLHTHLIRPLCSPPFQSCLIPSEPLPPPTRLRVVELSTSLLAGLGAGAGSWRIVRSKGGRGWYVDTACGWVTEVDSGRSCGTLTRNLAESHPYRMALNRLADANGNVSSGVGWHARKMEILHGHGMLGREDGLYGAVSFAYQG